MCAGYIMQQEVDKSTQNSQWGVTEVYMGMPVGLCKSINPGGTELQEVRVKTGSSAFAIVAKWLMVQGSMVH